LCFDSRLQEQLGYYFTEEKFMTIAKQILLAVDGIHTLGVAHNDIKLNNMVVDYHSVKFIDFGLATKIDNFHYSDPKGGTRCYYPPGTSWSITMI
jgi:serine/threonine protein kinase